MPGNRCSVAICTSHSTKANILGEKLVFFNFPKDKNVRKVWIHRCYRKDKWNPANGRICSKHFVTKDYEDLIKASIMNTAPRKLKPTAVPSQNLLPTKAKDGAQSPVRSSKYLKEKAHKLKIENIMSDAAESQEDQEIVFDDPWLEEDDNASVEKLNQLENQIKMLNEQNENLSKQVTFYKQILNTEEEKALALSKNQKSLMIEECNKHFEEKVKTAFKGVLTPNQIDIILKKKTKAHWTIDELNNAFALRYFSIRCYSFLRNTLHYPMPGLSTLRRWAGCIQLRNGILEDVLKIMAIAGKEKSEVNRITVLSFGKMKINSVYEYSSQEDEVVGPYTYMQVIMARGLFDSWKQPVYIGFDTKMTAALLMGIVKRLYEIDMEVVACVSDCGGDNQGLWNEMGISPEASYLLHPITSRNIFFFADVPHLLKLLRNCFLDKGFALKDGEVNMKPVQSLIMDTRKKINSCHKLTQMHLSCEEAQRQSVKLASQLFSNTTAEALMQYLPGEDENLAQRTSIFFTLVNNWFDTLNSYAHSASIPTKNPYGTHLKDQELTLKKMIETVKNMKYSKHQKTLHTLQNGIIMSSKSLIGLFNEIKNNYNISFILTHRLNQDCLENFFSQLRTKGVNPSPLNVLDQIRIILLGENPGIVQTDTNILPVGGNGKEDFKEDQYLVGSVLSKAQLKPIKEQGDSDAYILLTSDSESTSSRSSAQSDGAGKTFSEKDGLNYLAGYIAHEHRAEFLYLADHTYKQPVPTHNYEFIQSWIHSFPNGGWVQPSNIWEEEVKKMDHYFCKFHKETFCEKKNVVQNTTQFVNSKVQSFGIDPKLIASFCKLRVILRIEFLNSRSWEVKSLKRSKSSSEQDQKGAKKMKKK